LYEYKHENSIHEAWLGYGDENPWVLEKEQ
jgi:hypothetical protein